MKITLDTVRSTLRTAFGRESFVASFIKKVHADEQCPTAGIDADGAMRYNPDFVENHVQGPKDLFCLVAHELMHPMFGHFIYKNGELENIAADLVINATISLLFPDASGAGTLFKKYYKPTGLEGLLRPESQMGQSRYSRLYFAFYESRSPETKLSTGEAIQTLKILTPTQEVPVILLMGSHCAGGKGNADAPVATISAEDLAEVAEDFRRAVRNPGGHGAGTGENLYNFFLEVLKTHLSIKKVLLRKFATKRKVDRFKQTVNRSRIGVSPVPIQPSKRDLVLLAVGVPSLHYHNRVSKASTEDRGLAVYLDVSGSVNQHLPKILGILQSLKTELLSVFLFSNKVAEVSFKTLLKGHVQTTYGTDFDCIAESILERAFDKAVILTDGYASMSEANRDRLKEGPFTALTVLFGGKTDCPEFGRFGDVVQLEEVTN